MSTAAATVIHTCMPGITIAEIQKIAPIAAMTATVYFTTGTPQ